MTNEKKEIIEIRLNQVKRWANKLYFLAKEGLDYSSNDYDIKRYEEIKEISESLYKRWNIDKDTSNCRITLKQLKYFIFRLSKIAQLGLEHVTSENDESRYIETDLIGLDMEQIKHEYLRKKDAEIITTNTQKKYESKENLPLSQFLTDIKLSESINKIITESRDKLWICSPWIDDILNFHNQLTNLREKKVEIILVTRSAEINTTHYKALKDLKKKRFLIETNQYLHTKLIISDEKKMYIGSANMLKRSMTLESIRRNFEAGIITEDQHLIQPAIEYFNRIYDESGEERITQ